MANSCIPSSSATLACVLLFTKELLNSCKRKEFHSIVTIINNKLQTVGELGRKVTFILEVSHFSQFTDILFQDISSDLYKHTQSFFLLVIFLFASILLTSLYLFYGHITSEYMCHACKMLVCSFFATTCHLFMSPVPSQLICSFLV